LLAPPTLLSAVAQSRIIGVASVIDLVPLKSLASASKADRRNEYSMHPHALIFFWQMAPIML
jgi:hypothetical protein